MNGNTEPAWLRGALGSSGHNGGVPTYRDQAVVLRTHKLGEADRIVTMLSREHGKLRAVARGVRRYPSGQVIVETADRLVVEEGEPARQQYHLLVGALHALTQGTNDGTRPAAMVMDSYLLRALALAGYAPSLTDCARCGAAGPHQSFAPAAGGMVCLRCRPPASAHPASATIDYLAALLTGDWPATREVAEPVIREGSGLVAAFAAWHLERGLRSLTHVERD